MGTNDDRSFKLFVVNVLIFLMSIAVEGYLGKKDDPRSTEVINWFSKLVSKGFKLEERYEKTVVIYNKQEKDQRTKPCLKITWLIKIENSWTSTFYGQYANAPIYSLLPESTIYNYNYHIPDFLSRNGARIIPGDESRVQGADHKLEASSIYKYLDPDKNEECFVLVELLDV